MSVRPHHDGWTAQPTVAFTLQAGSILHFDVPGSFKLQHTTTPPTAWQDVLGTAPFDLPTVAPLDFFRLISL